MGRSRALSKARAEKAAGVLVSRKLDAPLTFESEIRRIAKSVQALREGPMKWDTVILLVSTASGVGKKVVKDVLEAVENLEENYLKGDDKEEHD